MKKVALGIILFVCLSAPVLARKPPPILMDAVRCLAVKHNFPSSKSTTQSFGYLVDDKSYPGEKVLYIVNYMASDEPNGFVFVIFLTQRDGRQVFNIQNNATFSLSEDDVDGITFLNPPLGGVWTQEHLALAIKKIEKRPRFSIPVKAILSASILSICESYTDR